MNNSAPLVAKVEVKFSPQGLCDFIAKLSEEGELSKSLFESISNQIIRNWRYPKKVKPVKNPKKEDKVKDLIPKKGGEPAPKVEKPKMVDKINGLRKLADGTGLEVTVDNFNDYVKVANVNVRNKLETFWAEQFKDVEAKERGAAYAAYLKEKGLTPAEINQSRSYFPKLHIGGATYGGGIPVEGVKEEEKVLETDDRVIALEAAKARNLELLGSISKFRGGPASDGSAGRQSESAKDGKEKRNHLNGRSPTTSTSY